ncbi:hypothetical protein X777_07419 [Ooceraea biroi]|uniref:Uncharacterized protein n=1 Tax=Ooceraea biroi TaxID=2015173 RepID=A0A026WAM2_OOCBI|nr:hypothetical protein X777_07419 [Ooceraea biroi]
MRGIEFTNRSNKFAHEYGITKNCREFTSRSNKFAHEYGIIRNYRETDYIFAVTQKV